MEKIELLTNNPKIFQAAKLDLLLPRLFRLKILFVFGVSLLVVLLIFVISLFVVNPSAESASGFTFFFTFFQSEFLSFFLLLFAPFWFFILVEFYYLSLSRPIQFFRYYKDNQEIIFNLDFEGAKHILYLGIFDRNSINILDLYDSFQASNFWGTLILRLGINPKSFREFINRKRDGIEARPEDFFKKLSEAAYEIGSNNFGAREFMLVLFGFDSDFESFLFERKIHKDDLIGASGWVSSILEVERNKSRWWDREVLARIPGLGKSFGFGYTNTLDRYSKDIIPSLIASLSSHFSLRREELKTLEEVLSRSGQMNILLVGEPGSGKHAMLDDLARMIAQGIVVPALEHKRLINLDAAAITAAAKTKGEFESLMIKMMNEAVSAGNIILVIDNLSDFIKSSKVLGTDLVSLIEPYLAGDMIQVIALSDIDSFHSFLEPNGFLMKLFYKLEVRQPTVSNVIFILQNSAVYLEKRFKSLIFSYQSLVQTAKMADRYIQQGVMPEKAIDLLDRVAVSAARKGKTFVMPEDVADAVEEATKIPVGMAGEEESKKLLKMEEILHERVIGQNEAIKVISNALRRARSGLHAGERPIGSFLFLGPTGVGKTQTAKSLAEFYFGSENKIQRFDMSEFQGHEGLGRLIGSFETKEQGILVTSLRSNPFSLLLFDEFEKSSKMVINIFLQILDEGVFKDAFGKIVSAKDAVIIATSNAGSNYIWDLIRRGKDPSKMQIEVIDKIRQEGVFSPEILNRFDAIVMFHPLNKDQLEKIARLMLEEFVEQLKKQDIEFVINQSLVKKIVEIGYDPAMGARPMRRAITDKVEQIIARKILAGELKRGSKFEFSGEEIERL